MVSPTARGKGGKGKGKGKVKNEDVKSKGEESKTWVPKKKPKDRSQYELRGWRQERCEGFADSIEKLFKNTDIKPRDFDELLLLFLEVLHRRGKAQDALEDLEKSIKDTKRSDIQWWTRFMYNKFRKFDPASYEALKGTDEYKKYKEETRNKDVGRRNKGHGPITQPLPAATEGGKPYFPLNRSATEFIYGIPLHPQEWTPDSEAAAEAQAESSANEDTKKEEEKGKSQLDAQAPEFNPGQNYSSEPTHPLLPAKQQLNRHAAKFVPQDAAPPFPESWAAALGEGKLEVDSEGQCICPFESSVLPDVVQLRIGVEDVRLQPPLANAPWNDAPGLVGKDFKCGVVLSEVNTSPPKDDKCKNSVVLIRHLLKTSKDEKPFLSDIVQKCAEAGASGVLVQKDSSLGQPGCILREGEEPTIPCVAVCTSDYEKLQAALLKHRNCCVWMRNGRTAELKHRWIRETLIPHIKSDDTKLKQVNLPSKRKGSQNCDFALTDNIADEILAALQGNTMVKSVSLVSPSLSSKAMEKVQAWNASKTS